MAIVEVNISMSVDGFVTGPNINEHPGLGEGGEILHGWSTEGDPEKVLHENLFGPAAVITSRKVFDGTGGWGEDGLYRMPVFVLTHRPHEVIVKGETTFTLRQRRDAGRPSRWRLPRQVTRRSMSWVVPASSSRCSAPGWFAARASRRRQLAHPGGRCRAQRAQPGGPCAAPGRLTQELPGTRSCAGVSAFRTIRSDFMARKMWLFTAPLLMPMVAAISDSDMSA